MNTADTIRAKCASHVFLGENEVGRIGYGAMRLGDSDAWEPPADREAAVAILREAADLGVDLFDTADSYALGANEEIVGEALAGRDVTIVTKSGVVRPGRTADDWIPLGRPEYLKQQAELSLRRLRRDFLPVYLLHRVDPTVPLVDQVGALKELQEEGKVGAIGLSFVTAPQIEEASSVAEISVVQNLFNLTNRMDSDVVDYCEERGIVYMPFFPLAIGGLANQQGSVLASIADELGVTSPQVALAWLLHRSPMIAPIPGTTSSVHLRENLAARDVELDTHHMVALADAF